MTDKKLKDKIHSSPLKKSYFAAKIDITINHFSNMINKENSAPIPPAHKTKLVEVVKGFDKFDKNIPA